MAPGTELGYYTMNRLLTLVTCFILVACSPPSTETQNIESAPDQAQVEAAGETLQGEILDSSTHLAVFRGIPFAAPPVGKLRWQPPQPHVAREGVQQAKEFGAVCPQNQGNVDFYRNVARKFGLSPDLPAIEPIEEDCLYLNVWTSALHADQKQPVMVWIYGGGNTEGYANDPDYFGDALAKRGVVYVSFNYRLALLGYMAHPGLNTELTNGVSGNYGILDQVAALNWVQENIAAFGGDPENVTILGESAGGANIGTLIASPLGAGLFDRAIIQSGGYEISSLYSLAEAEATGSEVAAALGFDDAMSDVEVVDGMRELDWHTFIDNPELAKFGRPRAVNIDGYVLPQSKASIFEAGSNNDVEVIIGTNANEMFANQSPDATVESFLERLEAYGEPYSTELREVLKDDIEADLQTAMDRFGSAEFFMCGSRYIANNMAANGSDVFYYYFTRVRPGGEKLLAYHGAEIPYALDTAQHWLPADETDKNLTAAMSQYWLNFASTGNPNGDGLAEWPQYDTDQRRYQVLGDEIKTRADLEPEICDILDRHLHEKMAALQ